MLLLTSVKWGQAFILCPCLLSCKRHIAPVHTSRGKIKKESSWDKKADNSMWDKNSGDEYNRGSYKKLYWDYICNLQGYPMILWFCMQCHENLKKKVVQVLNSMIFSLILLFVPCILNLTMGIKDSSNDQIFIHFYRTILSWGLLPDVIWCGYNP